MADEIQGVPELPKAARMKVPRHAMATQEPLARIRNFAEVALGYSVDFALEEAQRAEVLDRLLALRLVRLGEGDQPLGGALAVGARAVQHHVLDALAQHRVEVVVDADHPRHVGTGLPQRRKRRILRDRTGGEEGLIRHHPREGAHV